MSTQSLADRFIEVMALIRSLDDITTNDHPQRHIARSLRRIAEADISDSLRRAGDLVYQARDLETLVADVAKEARAAAAMAPTAPAQEGAAK